MKTALTLCLYVVIHASLFAQVGIGTSTPHSSAVLHIVSEDQDKGVLLPSMPDPTAVNKVDGILVYDNEKNRFAYVKNSDWIYVNPWDTETIQSSGSVDYISTPYNVGIKTSSAPTESLEVNGNIKSTGNISAGNNITATNELTAKEFVGYGTIPIGGIIMWSGNAGDVPDDYQLCNGGTKNGHTAPDLRGKFIRGATSSSPGSDDITYSTSGSEYTSDKSGCSEYEYSYRVSFELCDPSDPDPNNCFDYGSLDQPASDCSHARQLIIDTFDSVHVMFDNSGCDATLANSSYYIGNPNCFITADLNYYQLAYIMRVK